MIELEKQRNRAYYVEYHCKYFCIKERKVTEWKKSVERKSNNIIYFNKSY